ncbi:MAG: restriction endonuclease subunit S [Saprospiraceae bacterium]|nr:restriction endonuclease subunit S [Candidatus Vicinibacter affinis]
MKRKNTLGELVKSYGGKIQTGPFGSQLHQHDYKSEGIPVVMPKDIINDRIETGSIARINDDDADRLGKHKLKIGDLVLPRRGDINKRAICKPENEGWLCGTGCLKIRLNDEIVAPSYLYYYFRLSPVVDSILNKAVGSTMLNLSGAILSSTEIVYPPLPTQHKIASILSAYDDLIENNMKRIKLLDEIARITYEEWFVKFCVNGVKLETSKTTRLPHDWQMTSIKDYVGFISKGPSLDYNEGDIPVINQSCIRNGEIELEKILYAKELPVSKDDCYLELNDVLINSMGQGTLGRVSKNISITEKYIIHNCITVLRAKKELSQYHLFYFISSKQNYFESIAQGSTGQTTLKISSIEELNISVPPIKLLRDFDKIVDPLWKQIGCLKNQNTKLREARDILLPKLMSGQIEV